MLPNHCFSLPSPHLLIKFNLFLKEVLVGRFDILHSLLVECVDLGQEGVGDSVAPLTDLGSLVLPGVLRLLSPAVSSLVLVK